MILKSNIHFPDDEECVHLFSFQLFVESGSHVILGILDVHLYGGDGGVAGSLAAQQCPQSLYLHVICTVRHGLALGG